MDFGNILNEILRTTATSFDFAFVICVNIIAYFAIKVIDKLNGEKPVLVWQKRIVVISFHANTIIVIAIIVTNNTLTNIPTSIKFYITGANIRLYFKKKRETTII